MIKIKIIDLTHQLKPNTPKYETDPETEIKTKKETDYLISTIKIGTHTGTHIDAPRHYLKNGKTINQIPLENLIGPVTILKTKKNKEEIKLKDITNLPEKIEKIVILKTNWNEKWKKEKYFKQNPYPSKELVNYLIEKGIKGIGTDTPSIDHPEKKENHINLLKNNIWIVENLTKTEKLVDNKYYGYFIPIKLETEASPIRAFVKNIK